MNYNKLKNRTSQENIETAFRVLQKLENEQINNLLLRLPEELDIRIKKAINELITILRKAYNEEEAKITKIYRPDYNGPVEVASIKKYRKNKYQVIWGEGGIANYTLPKLFTIIIENNYIIKNPDKEIRDYFHLQSKSFRQLYEKIDWIIDMWQKEEI